jgi:8-oxo-dGTP pyrophosphatase MutT (NUDIX family)
MADYNKIGLLCLNEGKTAFLVCEPGEEYQNDAVKQYLMPGGQLEDDSDFECLKREIGEELDCGIKQSSLSFIGEYEDRAADPKKTVLIRLYKGDLIGKPRPSMEIGFLHWLSREDINNPKVSPIIKNKIIPDLVRRGILKG